MQQNLFLSLQGKMTMPDFHRLYKTRSSQAIVFHRQASLQLTHTNTCHYNESLYRSVRSLRRCLLRTDAR